MSSPVPAPAVAPRNRFWIAARRIFDLAHRARRRFYQRENAYRRVLYYPGIPDEKTLADLVNRAAWYLPMTTVSFAVAPSLAGVDLASLAAPVGQKEYRGGRSRMHLLAADKIDFSEHDVIFAWQTRRAFSPRLFFSRRPLETVDKNYFWSVESQAHARAAWRALDIRRRQELREISKANFQDLAARAAGREEAYIFGTGPSLSKVADLSLGGFKVVCNSIVKNRALLRHIRPDLLVFSDPVFHFSPCAYASEWRDLMNAAVEEFDLRVMTQEEFLPLLLAHFPHLKDRAIGMPTRRGFNLPTVDRFWVGGSINIMTSLMLPIASTFAQNVHIAGADGRAPDEKYFWRHDPSAQLGDLMESAVTTHPSFFRDRIYEDYYTEHNRHLDELLSYGETLGKRYSTITPSLMPALQKRPAPVKEAHARSESKA